MVSEIHFEHYGNLISKLFLSMFFFSFSLPLPQKIGYGIDFWSYILCIILQSLKIHTNLRSGGITLHGLSISKFRSPRKT